MTKILIIEDEATLREEIVEWLRFEDFETILAANSAREIGKGTTFTITIPISNPLNN